MNTKMMLGLSCILALGLAACSTSEGDNLDAAYTPPPMTSLDSGAAIDATPTPAPDPYLYVFIQDTEQDACGTNGPGADIDAVALLDATGAVRGWGMQGSAQFFPNPQGNACENSDCSGGNCKYADNGTYFLPETLPPLTEGAFDARVNQSTDDAGYFSLNAGTLRIQIGDAVTGAGPAQELRSGDYIMVYEVDQSYIASKRAYPGCACKPERYTVTLKTANNVSLELKPVLLDTNNTAAGLCDPLTAASVEGCGSTEFMIP
jgi:hypothetical protein